MFRRKDVDRLYEEFREQGPEPPRGIPRYSNNHFFARDPDGRLIEFQVFMSGGGWISVARG
ncbi:VOC family protein [Acidobacteriota bacterium]